MFVFCLNCRKKREKKGYTIDPNPHIEITEPCTDCGITADKCQNLIACTSISAPPEMTCGFVKAAVKDTLEKHKGC